MWQKHGIKKLYNFFFALNRGPTYTLPLFHTNGLGLILAPDISSRDILARTFHHGNFSAQGHFCTRTFQHGYILAPWMFFRHWNISVQGYFGTWTFWHIYILTPCKAIQTFWNRHFGPCAKMSLCPNILGSKCLSVVTSPCQNVHGVEKYPC